MRVLLCDGPADCNYAEVPDPPPPFWYAVDIQPAQSWTTDDMMPLTRDLHVYEIRNCVIGGRTLGELPWQQEYFWYKYIGIRKGEFV